MSSIQLAETTMIIGLTGGFIPTAYAWFLHKVRKQYSFTIIDNYSQIVIKRNPRLALLRSISTFFIYSLLTFSVGFNNTGTMYLQLIVIYALCFLVVFTDHLKKSKFSIVIDKEKQNLTRKGETYSLKEFNEFEISELNLGIEATYDSYGLYIKGHG